MLMDAIQRNGVDISQLASTLNCSVGQVQAAIQQVASQVCNVGNQVGMTGQQIINSIQQEQVVDLSIKIGDKVQPIEGLTPSTDIQDCGNGLFVSCNRDAVNAEVAAYMHNSEVAIADDVINAHRQIIESCKNIMVVLNPEIAERQRLEKENSELKTQLKELYKSQSEMKGMMASLLEQLGSPIKKS